MTTDSPPSIPNQSTPRIAFDVIVIGAGPAGHRAAVQASKLGAKVAICERGRSVGGACVTTGTIPSKTLHENVRYSAGLQRRSLAAVGGAHAVTMARLLGRKTQVISHEVELRQSQLARNNIPVLSGAARFLDSHTIEVQSLDGMRAEYTAKKFIIATGSKPARPRFWNPSLDDDRILDSDSVLELESVPKTLTVLGAGVIGCEYACIFAALGSKVTLIDRRDRLLRFMDREIADTLAHNMRQAEIVLKLGEELEDIGYEEGGRGRVQTRLRSGKVVATERLLIAMGRTSNLETLGLDAAGLEVEGRGTLPVNAHYQTKVDHIYAVGDVIGFPALASTSMEQGRIAASHAFDHKTQPFPTAFPFGVYTIPEVSYIGANEEELTEAKVPYEVGRAEFSESTRGKISGAKGGFVKLLFHRETLKLLGVHVVGEGACELVHIGQVVIDHGGTVDYFRHRVFNYPTFAECYKVAAHNGLNRL